jgi:hypothetical protein
MYAVLILGSVFLGRSRNYSSKLKANFQCHVVHSKLFKKNVDIKYETLNNSNLLLKDQSPQLLVFNTTDDTCPIAKINFKEHICENKDCEIVDYYLFPYCSDCFLSKICDNLVSIEFSEFNMKSNTIIMEKTVIFEYCFDHKTTSVVIENIYKARKIPVALMCKFRIRVEYDDPNICLHDLVYDYSDHLCVLHYIRKSDHFDKVNCEILCNFKEDGKYHIQLLTTKNIDPDEDIVIYTDRIGSLRETKYYTSYLI